MNNLPIIEAQKLSKSYQDGKNILNVLRCASCAFYRNDFAAILGPSGSGKSTLLHCLGALDRPDKGKLFWQGEDPSLMSEKIRCQKRANWLGFVYQFHHLLADFTALENVMLPALLSGRSLANAKEKAKQCLEAVQLDHRLHHMPATLSGGERQRTAIARSLVNDPMCVLADEPTGNLDATAALNFYNLIVSLKAQSQMAFIIVTHDQRVKAFANKIYRMDEGQLKSD